jgi:hypothetical protein
VRLGLYSGLLWHYTRDVSDWGLETLLTSRCKLSVKVALHAVLALRGISSACSVLLVPQSASVTLGVVLIACVGVMLIPRDLLE